MRNGAPKPKYAAVKLKEGITESDVVTCLKSIGLQDVVFANSIEDIPKRLAEASTAQQAQKQKRAVVPASSPVTRSAALSAEANNHTNSPSSSSNASHRTPPISPAGPSVARNADSEGRKRRAEAPQSQTLPIPFRRTPPPRLNNVIPVIPVEKANELFLDALEEVTRDPVSRKIVMDHTRPTYATCRLCKNKIMSSRMSNLTNHVRRHASLKQYKCAHCEYGHNEIAKVRGHMTHTHHDNESVPRDLLCPKMIKQWEILMEKCFPGFDPKTDIVSDHRLREQRSRMVMMQYQRNLPEEREHVEHECTHCGELVQDNLLLNHFIGKHRNEATPYRCSICLSEAAERSEITEHIRCRHPNNAAALAVPMAPGCRPSLFIKKFFPDASEANERSASVADSDDASFSSLSIVNKETTKRTAKCFACGKEEARKNMIGMTENLPMRAKWLQYLAKSHKEERELVDGFFRATRGDYHLLCKSHFDDDALEGNPEELLPIPQRPQEFLDANEPYAVVPKDYDPMGYDAKTIAEVVASSVNAFPPRGKGSTTATSNAANSRRKPLHAQSDTTDDILKVVTQKPSTSRAAVPVQTTNTCFVCGKSKIRKHMVYLTDRHPYRALWLQYVARSENEERTLVEHVFYTKKRVLLCRTHFDASALDGMEARLPIPQRDILWLEKHDPIAPCSKEEVKAQERLMWSNDVSDSPEEKAAYIDVAPPHEGVLYETMLAEQQYTCFVCGRCRRESEMIDLSDRLRLRALWFQYLARTRMEEKQFVNNFYTTKARAVLCRAHFDKDFLNAKDPLPIPRRPLSYLNSNPPLAFEMKFEPEVERQSSPESDPMLDKPFICSEIADDDVHPYMDEPQQRSNRCCVCNKSRFGSSRMVYLTDKWPLRAQWLQYLARTEEEERSFVERFFYSTRRHRLCRNHFDEFAFDDNTQPLPIPQRPLEYLVVHDPIAPTDKDDPEAVASILRHRAMQRSDQLNRARALSYHPHPPIVRERYEYEYDDLIHERDDSPPTHKMEDTTIQERHSTSGYSARGAYENVHEDVRVVTRYPPKTTSGDNSVEVKEEPLDDDHPLFTGNRPTEQWLFCSLCKREVRFGGLNTILVHAKRHYKNKQFACGRCAFTGSERSVVSEHLKQTHLEQHEQPQDNADDAMRSAWKAVMKKCFPCLKTQVNSLTYNGDNECSDVALVLDDQEMGEQLLRLPPPEMRTHIAPVTKRMRTEE